MKEIFCNKLFSLKVLIRFLAPDLQLDPDLCEKKADSKLLVVPTHLCVRLRFVAAPASLLIIL